MTLNDDVLTDILINGLNGTSEPPKPKEPVQDFEDHDEQEQEFNTTFEKEFGCLPPSGQDFGFWKYNVEDWEPEDQQHIPDQDDTYVHDYEVLEPMLRAHAAGLKASMYGPKGSGKTEMFRQIAAITRQPFFRINGRHDMESDTLLGKVVVRKGELQYQMADFPVKASKGYLILFDEWTKTPSGTQMALQRFYERNGIIQLDDMILKPGEDFSKKQIKADSRTRLYLADNVYGTGDGIEDYGATLIQDSSTLSRIDFILYKGYMKEQDEVQMIRRKIPKVSEQRALHMVRLANMTRTNKDQGKMGFAMDPRQLITWAEQAVILKDYVRPLKWIMQNRLTSDQEKALLANEFKTVFDLEF